MRRASTSTTCRTDKNGNYQPEQLVTYDAGSNPTRVVSRWSAMLTLRYTF